MTNGIVGTTKFGDMFLHAVDDYADIILAIVAMINILSWWKRTSLSDLKRANNILTILSLLVIVATVFGITQEINDPADFGNEPASLILGIFLLINRFI